MKRFRQRPRRRPTKIFFATDLHGSDVGFRKFLGAASFYQADALVYGGDLMGKVVVPIVRERDTYRAEFLGEVHDLDGEAPLAQFQRTIERTGHYWSVMEPDEYRETADDRTAIDALFDRLAAERLASWIEMAEDRLAGTEVRCFLTGGNDDTPSVLGALDSHAGDRVISAEHRALELDDRHTMITVGYSTPTPWDTPREATEEEIGLAIDRSMSQVPDPGRCVFNLHAPPIESTLDRCVKLEPTTGLEPGELPRPVREAGRFVYTSGGSRAVRDAIASYQPMAGLHGHIHESAGRYRIGRTPCFNPGSEYGQGLLHGVLLALDDGRVAGYQHTAG